eukprot:scaffold11578_cov109-Phaeocystis_antarctica.AAC.2
MWYVLTVARQERLIGNRAILVGLPWALWLDLSEMAGVPGTGTVPYGACRPVDPVLCGCVDQMGGVHYAPRWL